jgi:hypothetical protein
MSGLLWAALETIIVEIRGGQPLDEETRAGLKARLDPAPHKEIVKAQDGRDEREELATLWQTLNSAAYFRLRHLATRHGMLLPAPIQLNQPLVELAKSSPVQRRRGDLAGRAAASYGHTVAGVYQSLAGKNPPTTSELKSSKTPWARFAHAAFEYAGLPNWQFHARNAAVRLKWHLSENGETAQRGIRKPPQVA